MYFTDGEVWVIALVLLALVGATLWHLGIGDVLGVAGQWSGSAHLSLGAGGDTSGETDAILSGQGNGPEGEGIDPGGVLLEEAVGGGSAGDDAHSGAGEEEGPSHIYVHVAGAVTSPGVYQLPAGARAVDAVEMAGGPTVEGDLDAVNLAAEVVDGTQLYIPKRGEVVIPIGFRSSTGTGVAAAAAGGGAGRLVNINTASMAELDALPGIGPALAQRIVAWRQQNGVFTSIQQLTEVSGIGESRLRDLQDYVTLR